MRILLKFGKRPRYLDDKLLRLQHKPEGGRYLKRQENLFVIARPETVTCRQNEFNKRFEKTCNYPCGHVLLLRLGAKVELAAERQ